MCAVVIVATVTEEELGATGTARLVSLMTRLPTVWLNKTPAWKYGNSELRVGFVGTLSVKKVCHLTCTMHSEYSTTIAFDDVDVRTLSVFDATRMHVCETDSL